MTIKIKSSQSHSACALTRINKALEELPYVSSDCCSACQSSVTLLLLLAARLRIRGFRLSSVGKASKPFKQTMIYKMRLRKCHEGTRALGQKTTLPRFKTKRSQTVNVTGVGPDSLCLVRKQLYNHSLDALNHLNGATSTLFSAERLPSFRRDICEPMYPWIHTSPTLNHLPP